MSSAPCMHARAHTHTQTHTHVFVLHMLYVYFLCEYAFFMQLSVCVRACVRACVGARVCVCAKEDGYCSLFLRCGRPRPVDVIKPGIHGWCFLGGAQWILSRSNRYSGQTGGILNGSNRYSGQTGSVWSYVILQRSLQRCNLYNDLVQTVNFFFAMIITRMKGITWTIHTWGLMY